MKHSIKLSVLFLLFSTGIFAAVPSKPIKHVAPSIKGMVSFSSTPSKRGVAIRVNENAADKAVVMIYNWDNDVVWKDVLKKNKGMGKAYNLSQLDNGNYTVEVTLNKQMVRKTAHVYYRGDTKFVQLRG
jgi:hypothetical protein